MMCPAPGRPFGIHEGMGCRAAHLLVPVVGPSPSFKDTPAVALPVAAVSPNR